MNTIQASRLIQTLENQKLDYSKPIKFQLHKFFILSFWDGNLALRNSWKGRIASFLERPSESHKNNKKIDMVFSEAIRSVINHPVESHKLNPVLSYRLIEELCDEDILQNLHASDTSFRISPETQSLKNQKEEASAAYWKKIKSLSYLHTSSILGNANVDLKTLHSLKSYNGAINPIEALDFLEQFLVHNPEYGVLNWRTKLKEIKEACALDEKIHSQFQRPPSTSAEEESSITNEHTKLLHDLSKQWANTVASLDSAKKEKKLILFSYGPKILTIASFLEFMRKVPEPLLASVSQQYKNLLQSDELESIEKVGEKFVRAFFNKLKSSPNISEKLHPLGKNLSRKLPDHLASKLPKLIEIWLENFLKTGIIGNASTVMPKKYSSFLESISDHSDILQDAAAVEKIENLFVDIFKKKFKTFHQEYGNALIDFFKLSQAVLSPQLLELLGIEHIMTSGPLWMEFEKNLDGTYNIIVYTLGNSLNYHPIDLATGKQYGVLRLANIKAEKLNNDFFLSLLKRHLDPINDPSASSKAYDIYTGPLKTLEASVDKNHPGDPKDLASIPSTNWQLTLSLLLKKDSQKNNALLQVYLQAAVGFCRAHVHNGKLSFHNMENCKALEPILGQVEKFLVQSDLSRYEKKRIKATCSEIRHAIYNCHKDKLAKIQINIKNDSVIFDKVLLKSLRECVSNINISQNQLLEYRGTLCYFFGQEVGEFIDHILENSVHLLREEIPAAPQQSNRCVDQLYISMYANIIRHALQATAIGIGFAYGGWMSLLAFGGLWYLLPVPVLDKIIPYILSSTGLEGYERIKDAMSRKLYEFLLAATLFLIPKVRRENIKKQILEWQNNLKETTATLQGEKRVSYHLPAPLPGNKDQVPPKSFHIKSNLFKQGLRGLNRFCKLEQIQCEGIEGTNYFSKITFHQKLLFNVHLSSKGILEATSEAIPGFHIAENQKEEALKRIPNYLLLQNNDGRQKVLILKNQALQTLIGRLAYFTGPFSEVWMSTTASMNAKMDEYFIFDLEPCRSIKENYILKSNDPGASLYLLCLYYLLNNKKALKLALHHFNWICNNEPIPTTILENIVPLAMIPFDLAGLRQFRRKLFSFIGQNQMRFKQQVSQEASKKKNLILGLVALIDLNAHLDSKNPCEDLSVFQEYCLYKFAFQMLASLLKTKSKTLNHIVDEPKVENLIELVGLSSNLVDRYTQIKDILGIKESWKLWGTKHAVKILKTPSTFPDDVSYGDQSDAFNLKNEKYSLYITRLLSYCRNIKGTYIKFLKIDELSNVMESDLESIPKLKADEMTPEFIKKRFPAYYSMARKDGAIACSSLEREQLLHSLRLLKGMGDKQTQVLSHYLQTAILYGEKCPSTKKLISALNKQKMNPAMGSEFHTFFKEINGITFGALIEKDLADTHLHSFTQFIGKYMTASAVTNLLISPQMFPPGIEQVGADIIASTLKYLIVEKFHDVSDPIFKQINSSEAFIEKSDNNSMMRGVSRVLNAVAPLWVIWNACDYIHHFNVQPTATYPQIDETQSTLCYLSYKSLTIVGTAFLRIALAKAMKKRLKFSSLFVLPTWYYSLLFPPLLNLSSKTYNYLKPFITVMENKSHTSTKPYVKLLKRTKIKQSFFEETESSIHQFLTEQHRAFASKDSIDKKSILTLYLNLKDFSTKLAQYIKKEKIEVIELFNKPIKFKGSNLTPLSINDIQILIDNGRFEQISREVGFSYLDLSKTHQAIAKINYKKIRLKQMKQLLNQIRPLLREKASSKFPEKVKNLVKNLQSSAISPLQNVPAKNVPIYLQHQASSKTDLIPFDIFSNHPFANIFQAGSQKFILVQDPAELPSVHQGLLDIFGNESYVLKINREMPIPPQQFQTILISHIDLQRLQSIFIDRMHKYTHLKNERTVEDKESLIFIKQILSLIKKHGKAPQNIHFKSHLAYPIRKLKTISSNFYNITESCIKLIISDPDLQPLIHENRLSAININIYHEIVKPRLTDKMCRDFHFKFLEKSKQKELIDFACDRLDEIPSWIQADDNLFSEISLIKGIFHHMLPLRITKKEFDNTNSMKIPYESLFYAGLNTAFSKPTQLEASLSYFRTSIWKKCAYWKYSIQNTPTDFVGLFDAPPFEPKQEAYNKILAVADDDFKTWMSLYETHEQDLIDTTEDDPANLFGFTSYEASQPGFINPLVDLGIEQHLELTKTQMDETPSVSQ